MSELGGKRTYRCLGVAQSDQEDEPKHKGSDKELPACVLEQRYVTLIVIAAISWKDIDASTDYS